MIIIIKHGHMTIQIKTQPKYPSLYWDAHVYVDGQFVTSHSGSKLRLDWQKDRKVLWIHIDDIFHRESLAVHQRKNAVKPDIELWL